MKISVVVPLHNEEGNVLELYKQISETIKQIVEGKFDSKYKIKTKYDSYNIILVDDGSKDNTFSIASKINDPKLKIIKFRKNFGQSAGLLAGFDYADGDIIVTLDGDLQNDPKDIPKLLAKLEEGYDCISGWRKNRNDKLSIKIFSRTSNFIRHILIKDTINDSGCSLKVYKKECIKDLELYGEMHRYIVSLVQLKGFKVAEVVVNHRARVAGKTNYNLLKVVKGFLDIWSVWFWQKFAVKPMQFFGIIGLATMFFGFISGSYAVYLKIFKNIDLSNTFLSTVSIFAIMLGVQLFVLGILGDVLIKTYMHTKNAKTYSVEKIIDKEKNKE